MSKLLLMTFTLVAAIACNLAVTMFSMNGTTTNEITGRLPVLFNPAHYVFLIWVAIYGSLFYWISKSRSDQTQLMPRRVVLFLMACGLQIAWMLLWQFEQFNWSLAVKAALLLTLTIFYFTYPSRENKLAKRAPISLFFAWTSVTFISNLVYVLMLHDWSGWGLSDPLWTVIYMTIGAAVALHFMYHHGDYVFILVYIWTFLGIAVKNGTDELFVSSAAIFLLVVLAASFLFLRDPKRE